MSAVCFSPTPPFSHLSQETVVLSFTTEYRKRHRNEYSSVVCRSGYLLQLEVEFCSGLVMGVQY